MVRIGVFFGVVLAVLAVGGSARAASLIQERKWCASGDASLSIQACSALIDLGRGHLSQKELAGAYTHRGQGYADRGQAEKAIEDFSQAIGYDPTRADAFAGRGIQYYKQGDYKHAVADFDAAIRLDPDEAVDWAWRARAKGQLGDADGANADEAHALKLDPQVENDMRDGE
jgi:Tfp pilus assembly protein PilF